MSRIDEALKRAQAASHPASDPGDTAVPAPELFRDAWAVGETGPAAPPAKLGAAVPPPLPPGDVVLTPPPASVLATLAPSLAEKVVVTPGIRPAFVEQYRKLAGTLHHAQIERSIEGRDGDERAGGRGQDADRHQPRAHARQLVPALGAAHRRRPAAAEPSRGLPGAEHHGPRRRAARRLGAEAVAGAGIPQADAADRRPARSRPDQRPDLRPHAAGDRGGGRTVRLGDRRHAAGGAAPRRQPPGADGGRRAAGRPCGEDALPAGAARRGGDRPRADPGHRAEPRGGRPDLRLPLLQLLRPLREEDRAPSQRR